MANTYETIIIILAMALNTGIILWFITNYNDAEFGGNPTFLNINYNKNKVESKQPGEINAQQFAIH